MHYYVHADRFYLPKAVEAGGYLEITDGKFGAYYPENARPEGEIVDYTGYELAPGYVDTHIHGSVKEDVMKSDWAGIDKLSKALLGAGVTSWLPTTVTASSDQLTAVCRMFAAHQGEESGAKIQGIHFEGPFFTEEHAGAENPKYMLDPNREDLDRWLEASKGMLKKIALAPERPGTTDFIRYATSRGVMIALGHSSASYDEAKAAAQAGAEIFTHTFNGMPDFSHNQPNIANAAMALDNMDNELIADGHHVAIPAIKALIAAKGVEHIVLITDCMEAGMMPDGDYMLGELPVYVKDGMARLKDGDNLAGSVLQLKNGVKNLVDWGLVTKQAAIQMATYNAARSHHLLDQCGQIAPGLPADFLILRDDMSLAKTYLSGEIRWEE
ncbi:N-acetylglucosamine-6-phosphate deacetylase [Lactobacillus equicursoris]|uniref:N-acetylglucosamine-6-phosphate deacetylase n=1 Tax=Lactobacillus equicursoris TaxID=420645 RepID=A0A844FMK6_9LACO|nr:N-acetylglucosamine-6-phosphate deacetylase [Lactobacillus equicursoris]MST79598.1 N-acetylglucosamine-6-phosphate deacetylase [Lactobacillus equicursoris]